MISPYKPLSGCPGEEQPFLLRDAVGLGEGADILGDEEGLPTLP